VPTCNVTIAFRSHFLLGSFVLSILIHSQLWQQCMEAGKLTGYSTWIGRSDEGERSFTWVKWPERDAQLHLVPRVDFCFNYPIHLHITLLRQRQEKYLVFWSKIDLRANLVCPKSVLYPLRITDSNTTVRVRFVILVCKTASQHVPPLFVTDRFLSPASHNDIRTSW